jgi:glycosyltransferase involved in cell wall biosynthesis
MTGKKLASYEREVCGRFAECLTCSEEEAHLLHELTGATNVRVIPNGIDTDTHAPGDNDKVVPNRLVFVGRMDYHANVDGVRWFCAEVLPRIHAERPDVVFQIVGGHPTREVQRLGKDPRIEVTGLVDDVRPYLRAAAVVVIPLRVGGGTRLKLMEALAMGKPVVSTRLGAEGIAVASGTEVLLADDALDLAQQTLHLLQRPALGRRLGEAGRRLVEDRYSWQMIASQLERVYEQRLQLLRHLDETFAAVPSLSSAGRL